MSANGGAAGDPRALERLAERLRERPVIEPHVRGSEEAPALGMLVAAGPRAAEGPDEYTLLFEAVREGYLLHYGDSRLLDHEDPDLNLLAGDYLYALGLERLAARGDLDAVAELGDLISLSAQLHARAGAGSDALPALWLASAVAVGAGADPAHEDAKAALRGGDPEAGRLLAAAAAQAAAPAGMGGALASAAESIGFAAELPFDRG